VWFSVKAFKDVITAVVVSVKLGGRWLWMLRW